MSTGGKTLQKMRVEKLDSKLSLKQHEHAQRFRISPHATIVLQVSKQSKTLPFTNMFGQFEIIPTFNRPPQ